MVASARRTKTEDERDVNPILGVSQIIVSIALIAAILLQARGTGLSGRIRWRLGCLSQPP